MTEQELTPRERRHARTRQAILDAARRIVSRQGADALSMRAIADEIDYSAAGLYEYFDSKDAIIGELCQIGHERLTAAMAASDDSLPYEQFFFGIGRAYIDFAQHNPDLYLLMFAQAPEWSAERMMDRGSSYLILLNAIQRGLDEGHIAQRKSFSQEDMAFAAWATVHGIAMLAITYFRDAPVDLSHAQDEALRNLLRGFA